VVLVRQLARVAQGGVDVGYAVLAGPLERVVEHLLLDVEDLDGAVGAQPAREIDRVVAGPGTDLEHPLPWIGGERFAQPPAGDQRGRRPAPLDGGRALRAAARG